MPRIAAALIVLAWTSTAAAQDFETERDIQFSSGKHALTKLDVYSPAKGEGHPIMVYIHGGGWRRGDKAAVALKPKAFTEKGFVFVSANYRLVPAVTSKDQAADVAKAVAWIHQNAKKYGGDPDRWDIRQGRISLLW